MVTSAKHFSSSLFLHNSSRFPPPRLSILVPTANTQSFPQAWEPQEYFGEFRSKYQATEQVSHITTSQAEALKASGFGEDANTELPDLLLFGVCKSGSFILAIFLLFNRGEWVRVYVLPIYTPLCSKTGICLPYYWQLLSDRARSK